MTIHPAEDKALDLKAQAVILEAPVQVKEIVEEFLLITYDVPVSDEGNKARTEFLQRAASIGAVMHTESVYYMPWTQVADITALKLSKIGKVYAWYAKADPETARDLTRHYDQQVMSWIDELDKRLDKIMGHINDGHIKLAHRMIERTLPMISEQEAIIKRRGSPALETALQGLKRTLGILVDEEAKRS